MKPTYQEIGGYLVSTKKLAFYEIEEPSRLIPFQEFSNMQDFGLDVIWTGTKISCSRQAVWFNGGVDKWDKTFKAYAVLK